MGVVSLASVSLNSAIVMSPSDHVSVNETSRLLFVGSNTTSVVGMTLPPRTHRGVLGAVYLGFTSTVARIVASEPALAHDLPSMVAEMVKVRCVPDLSVGLALASLDQSPSPGASSRALTARTWNV